MTSITLQSTLPHTPPFLKDGDKVALISPASIVKEEYIRGAANWIKAHGWVPVLIPNETLGTPSGSFADTTENRKKYLLEAISDKSIKAIFCARGGYGCAHLLDSCPSQLLIENKKWILGFSDISALHALFNSNNICSLHAPMAKHVTLHPDDEPATRLADILSGRSIAPIVLPFHKYNRQGDACGVLEGGNMAVINGLAATPFDIFNTRENIGRNVGKILFFEDIAEPIYKIERIFLRLHLSGDLSHAKGLIFGQFTEYNHPDRNFNDMEEMIHNLLKSLGYYQPECKIPIVFNFPTGHVDYNLPLIEGALSRLTVSNEKTILQQTYNSECPTPD